MSHYYQTQDKACLQAVLESGRSKSVAENLKSSSLTGFFTGVLKKSPEARRSLLASETGSTLKTLLIVSLYQAGLDDDARAFAEATQQSQIYGALKGSSLPTIDKIMPKDNPSENDLLITAYMGSGDVDLITHILDNFQSVDEAEAEDALRIAFISGKFGSKMAAPGRQNTMAMEACNRYHCKDDAKEYLHVLTLASGLWALQSLARDDANIRDALTKFFDGNERLKSLYVVEQTAFGNYLTSLMTFNSLKNFSSADESAYHGFDQSLLTYEKFGSAEDAAKVLRDAKPQ